jgi:hypothetical protein
MNLMEALMAKLNPIELQKSLKGVDYPASKADLVKAVENNGGNDEVRGALDKLPEKTFETPADVTEAIDFGAENGNS